MNKIGIIALVLLGQISFAQVTKNLGDFDEIKVYDKLNVKLVSSSENKIVISGERENEVEVVNNNGELKIRMPFPKLMSGNDISIKLYFKNIESITAGEGSKVASDAVFKQTFMNLNAKEGANIELNLDVDKANVKSVSGGLIKLSGEAVNQDVVITAGGILQAKDLHSSQTTISLSAGGNAEIYATSLVDAKIKAGGSIFIYGKPKQINKETLLGGKIEEKN